MPATDDVLYYSELEAGARFLAAAARDGAERDVHLGMASKYAHLRADANAGRN